MEPGNACPICGGTLRLIAHRNDKYSYYSCQSCTHVTCLPLPTAQEIADFYNGFLFGKSTQQKFEKTKGTIIDSVRRILSDVARIADLRAPLDLLDWGGGTGFYSNAFAELGCDVTMIDIDSQACDYAQTAFGPKFHIITADPLRHQFTRKYDVVFCNQVIEHYPDPFAMLSAIKAVLSPRGVLIVTTPNQGCKEFWFRRDWLLAYLRMTVRRSIQLPGAFGRFLKTPWICCDPPRHLHAFNKASLSRLFSNAGFTVLETWGEYSTSQYYSKPTRFDWQIRRVLSLVRIVEDIPNRAGIVLLSKLDPNGRWGNNLVAYACL